MGSQVTRSLEEKKGLILKLLLRKPRLSALKVRMGCGLGNECQGLLHDMTSDGLLNFLPPDNPGSKGIYVVTMKGLNRLRS